MVMSDWTPDRPLDALLSNENRRCVVHYQLPATVDTYIHRSGRTARAGEDGVSIALVTPREQQRWAALLRALDRPQPMPVFPIDRTLMPQVTCP